VERRQEGISKPVRVVKGNRTEDTIIRRHPGRLIKVLGLAKEVAVRSRGTFGDASGSRRVLHNRNLVFIDPGWERLGFSSHPTLKVASARADGKALSCFLTDLLHRRHLFGLTQDHRNL